MTSIPSPGYGRFTFEPPVSIARCSEGHAAKLVISCDRPRCDAEVCEWHSVVCVQCGDVLCPRHGEMTEVGWCESCTEMAYAFWVLAWWLGVQERRQERLVRLLDGADDAWGDGGDFMEETA